MIARAAVAAKLGIKAHAHMLRHACGFKLANDGIDTRSWQACGTRSAFPWFESYSGGLGKLVGPSVDDGMAIDVVDAGHDALLEFVL